MKNKRCRFFRGIPVLLGLIFWVTSCTKTVSIDSYVFSLDDLMLPSGNNEQLFSMYDEIISSHYFSFKPLAEIYGTENPLYQIESPLWVKADRLQCTEGNYTPVGDIEFGGVRYTGNDIADIAKTSALSKLPVRLFFPKFTNYSGSILQIVVPLAAVAAGANIPAGGGDPKYPVGSLFPSPYDSPPYVIKTDPAEWADFYIREVTSVFFVLTSNRAALADYPKLTAMAGIAMVRRNPDIFVRENPNMIGNLDRLFREGKRSHGYTYFVWFSVGHFPDFYKDRDFAIWDERLMNPFTRKHIYDLTDTDGTTDINALTGISPESDFDSEDAQANTAFFLKQKGEKLVAFNIPRYKRSVMNFCSEQAAADFREQLKEFFIREKTETEAEKAAFYETLKPLDLSILPPGSAHFFEPRLPQDRTADTP